MSKIRDGLRLLAEGLADELEARFAKEAVTVTTSAVVDVASVAAPEQKSAPLAQPTTPDFVALRKQCTNAVIALCKKSGQPAAVALLTKFSAKNVPGLKDEQLEAFLKEAV